MKRPLVAVGLLVVLTLAITLGFSAPSTASPARPAKGSAPVAAPTLPVPVPSLPLPTPSGGGSPSPSPRGSQAPPGTQKQPCPKRSGTTVTFCFDPHMDRSSWYWQEQQTQNVPGTGVILKFESPQSEDTLPVTAQKGEQDRVSAVYFDLISHGIPFGARITKLVLTMEEGTGKNQGAEQPEYNTVDRTILACPVTSIWAAGEAEMWTDRPKVDQAKCVESKHDSTKLPNPTWTWDLSGVAARWAVDPYLANNGVVLIPKIVDSKPDSKQWQVNLKIPARDDSATAAVDEYQLSRGRTFVTMSYAKPRPTHTNPPPTQPPTNPPVFQPPPDSGTGGGSNLFGGPPVGGSGGSTGGFSGPPSTGGSNAPPPSSSGGSSVPKQRTQLASPAPIPTVKFPWYVWVLLPIALLAIAAVRSVLFEQARAGIRPDGVIAAIRSRNEAAGSQGAMGGILARARELKEGLARGGSKEAT